MEVLYLKFNPEFTIEKSKVFQIDNIKELKLNDNSIKQEENGIIYIELNENEFYIIGETIDKIIEILLKDFAIIERTIILSEISKYLEN